MIFRGITAALLFFMAITAKAESLCYGPKDASLGLIYFHGFDSSEPGSLELSNRKVLKRLADDLKIRIALPRARKLCRDEKVLCWDYDTREGALKELDRARRETAECLRGQKKLGAIGFSNGGYFLGKILQHHAAGDFQFLIASGSAGEALEGDDDLSSEPPIQLMIGKHDVTLNDAKKYFEYLKQKGAKVGITEFSGNHELEIMTLRAYLNQSL